MSETTMTEIIFIDKIGEHGMMEYWIEVTFDRESYCKLGPYDTESDRDVMYQKMLAKVREESGTVEGPTVTQ